MRNVSHVPKNSSVYSFLADEKRTDGPKSDRAGVLRGLGFCLRTLSVFVFIKIGPCRFNTLMDIIACR